MSFLYLSLIMFNHPFGVFFSWTFFFPEHLVGPLETSWDLEDGDGQFFAAKQISSVLRYPKRPKELHVFFFPAKIAGESYGVRAFCCKIWRSAQESSSGSVSSHPASVYWVYRLVQCFVASQGCFANALGIFSLPAKQAVNVVSKGYERGQELLGWRVSSFHPPWWLCDLLPAGHCGASLPHSSALHWYKPTGNDSFFTRWTTQPIGCPKSLDPSCWIV